MIESEVHLKGDIHILRRNLDLKTYHKVTPCESFQYLISPSITNIYNVLIVETLSTEDRVLSIGAINIQNINEK